jgi:hypothetical protein
MVCAVRVVLSFPDRADEIWRLFRELQQLRAILVRDFFLFSPPG